MVFILAVNFGGDGSGQDGVWTLRPEVLDACLMTASPQGQHEALPLYLVFVMSSFGLRPRLNLLRMFESSQSP